MKVGVPTEIKTDEYRVALTPSGVRELTDHGHEVLVQAGAGEGSAIADDGVRRRRARAIVAGRRARVRRGRADRQGQGAAARRGRDAAARPHAVHLPAPGAGAGADARADGRRARRASPTRRSRTRAGRLPLLAPMSEVAGKIATQAGAFMLEKPLGGRGLLLGGVPGVAAGKVMVIGGGVVGQNAAEIAIGMGAETYVYDRIDRPAARARGPAQRPLLDVLRLDAGDRGAAARDGPRHRRGAGPRGARRRG